VRRLIQSHLTDDRWREVFLLTASLLDDANAFFEWFLNAVGGLIEKDRSSVALLHWANEKAAASKQPGTSSRAVFLFIALDLVLASNPDLDLSSTIGHVRDLALSLARDLALDLDRDLAHAFALAHPSDSDATLDPARARARSRNLTRASKLGVELKADDYEREWNLTTVQAECLTRYLMANQLLVECLRLAAVSNRAGIEARLLLPPGTQA